MRGLPSFDATPTVRQPLIDCREDWERLVGQGLVPVRRRRPVPILVVRMPMLNAEQQTLREMDRVFNVKPVLGMLASVIGISLEMVPVVRSGKCLVQVVVIPGATEVILSTRSMKPWRPRFAVDEEHVIALAHHPGVGRSTSM